MNETEEEELEPEEGSSGDTVPAVATEDATPPRRRGRPPKARNGITGNGSAGPGASGLDRVIDKQLNRFRTVSEVAQSLAVDGDALDQPNPALRERPTFSGAVVEDQGDDVIRNYDDLLLRFPFDSGQYYILVDRKVPRHFNGVAIAGVQRPVRSALTFDEFVAYYGGGEYVLTVYGPPVKGPQEDGAGRPIVKALTKPIKVTVPISMPPNVDAAVHGGEDNDMETRPSMATNATARMHEVDVKHAETMDERKTRAEREVKEERDRQDVERRRGEISDRQLANEQHERELARLERIGAEQKAEAERRMEELKQQQQSQQLGLKELAGLLNNKSSPADIERLEARNAALTDAHLKELARLAEVHREDVKRLTDQGHAEVMRQRDENKSERDRLDKRMQEVEDRATSRIREAEERATTRVKEVEDRARNQVSDAERSFNQRLQDQHQQSQNRMTDEARNHERDLRQQQQAFDMRFESSRGTSEAQSTIKDQELARMRSELAEARKKANQPIAERIAEVTEAAEALGMRPAGGDDEPQDWKSMAMSVVQNVAGRLPELVKGAGEMYAAVRAPQPQPGYSQQQQVVMARAAADRARMLAPPPMRAPLPGQPPRPLLGFATDDGPAFAGADGPVTAFVPPPVPIPIPMVAAPPPPAPAPQPAPSVPPPTPSVAPPPLEAAAPAVSPSNPLNLTLEQLLQVEETLVSAMNSKAPPDQVADFFAKQLGPDQLQAVLGQVHPEQIQTTLRQVGKGNSPLCRREGKKFLEELWKAIRRISK